MFGHSAAIKRYLEAEGFSLVKDSHDGRWSITAGDDVYLTALHQGELLKRAEKEFGIRL